jgi:ATP-dependent Clp protease ATP-binding subunit ClpX
MPPLLPKDIYEYMAKRVLGQREVLRLISVAVYKHVSGVKAGNILLVGNSGTGKTTIMKTIHRFYQEHEDMAPFRVMAVLNANILAGEEGDIRTGRLFTALEGAVKKQLGEDVDRETMLQGLQNATVCLDEVDKISARISGKSNPVGIALQQALLTILEGETIMVPVTVRENGQDVAIHLPVDTGKILFVCGGAFEELYDQVQALIVNRKDDRRLKETTEIQRTGEGEVRVTAVTRFKLVDYLRLSDMFTYGMLPQFLSRFSSMAILDDLSREDLVKILLEADDSPLRHCREFFSSMGIDLRITQEALDTIAEHALRNTRIGARALRELFSRIMADAEFDPFGQPRLQQTDKGRFLTIDRAMVQERLASRS